VKRRVALLTVLATLALIGATNVPAGAGPGSSAAGTTARLQMYTVVTDQAGATAIKSAGYDIASVESTSGGLVSLEIVAYPSDRGALEKFGSVRLWRNDAGLTSTQLAEQQASAGFKVWMDYDGPDGFEQYMYDLEEANEDILNLEVVGPRTHQDRDIIALRLTDESTDANGDKPAVLYSSMIHAREWIAGEVNRRLLEWFIKGWREEKPEVVDILQTTELWFVLVQNPDGYQYTFDGDRLWRKNLRDNDNDGQITILDGVDGNRNFAEHWNFDDEGSASIISDETYRGPTSMSEPETKALDAVLARAQPEYHISYHSFGELLLYPFGFQVNTPSADDPIFVAWAGTDKKPAVQGYDPGVGADLYTTNGEQTDYAYSAYGSLAITPELGEGNQNNGFEFPDSEGEVQHEFMINLDFAVAAAKSAADPDNPASPVNLTTKPFYLNTATVDPQKSFNPMSDFTFAHSFNGNEQPVQVLARRDLNNDGVVDVTDDVKLHYTIDGVLATPAGGLPTTEWPGGDRYGETGDVYYHVVGGTVTDAPEGSDVQVWFTGAGKTSPSFTFHVEKSEASQVLILADTDYTGPSNFPAYVAADGQPPFLTAYEDAVAASGRTYDVYDVDALGAAPDHLGVLGHYEAVIWYTANDLVSRVPGQPGGTGAETQANTMMLEVRAFLNEGGRLLYTGRHAGWQFANAFNYNPVSTPPLCDANQDPVDGCLFLSDDFLQYWLGAYLFVEDGGTNFNPDPDVEDEPAIAYPVSGAASPYDVATTDPWTIDQSFDVGRGATTQSFITTSSILKTADYPQFTSSAPGVWDTGVAGAYEPHTGDFYMYSQRADIRYQRLMNTFTVDDGTDLSFFVSYDTEPNWDFVFVELQDENGDWVTLPEANGHTSESTGDSCPEGWHELHPWLVQYQGADCAGDPDGDGISDWNAASGRSNGWQEWEFDLSAYAGQEVTVSISYASDWAVQGLGTWVDDIDAPTTAVGADTGFETDSGSWIVGDPEEIGSSINALDWIRTEDVGFTEGAMTSMTPTDAAFRTLYFGFGFENVDGAPAQTEIMDRALDYLIGP
jgi:Zinc carboxypeptidase/Immune inhibitor A-like, MAM domain